MRITVETSARHIHLSEKDFHILFGKNATLTKKLSLSQPGQYLCNEKVKIVGPRNSFNAVSIIGPTRNQTQVELSATDARIIGVSAPIRESGDLQNTPGCEIIGPSGNITIPEGVIIAKRHIHLRPNDTNTLNITDGQIISVKVISDQRSLTFNDVVARVRSDFYPVFHIDTDESNAAGINTNTKCEIII